MRNAIRRGRRRKGAALLEFILVFPFAMALVMFAIDIGRVYMTLNAVEYAAARAARAGALYGAAGLDAPTAGPVCAGSLERADVREDHMVLDTFCQRLNVLPGGSFMIEHLDEVSITGGDGGVGNLCTSSTPYVTVHITASIPSYTPGIAGLLSVTGWDDGWQVEAAQTALCDIVPVAP